MFALTPLPRAAGPWQLARGSLPEAACPSGSWPEAAGPSGSMAHLRLPGGSSGLGLYPDAHAPWADSVLRASGRARCTLEHELLCCARMIACPCMHAPRASLSRPMPHAHAPLACPPRPTSCAHSHAPGLQHRSTRPFHPALSPVSKEGMGLARSPRHLFTVLDPCLPHGALLGRVGVAAVALQSCAREVGAWERGASWERCMHALHPGVPPHSGGRTEGQDGGP
jgi:hypothetical protein